MAQRIPAVPSKNAASVKSSPDSPVALGFNAIKNGIKRDPAATRVSERKPPWLRARIGSGKNTMRVRRTVRDNRLSTVCEESHCPNIGECWDNGTATIMLMGSVCTRACRFCAVDTGNPNGWLDADEPANAAEAVRLMDLRYIVLTSVDRDDLRRWRRRALRCVRASDQGGEPGDCDRGADARFQWRRSGRRVVVDSPLQVFAQNIETVERLTHPVRDPRAGYARTLGVLHHAKRHRKDVLTKSSLMLGLGETDDEIRTTMDDLRARGVDLLTLGQYLNRR